MTALICGFEAKRNHSVFLGGQIGDDADGLDQLLTIPSRAGSMRRVVVAGNTPPFKNSKGRFSQAMKAEQLSTLVAQITRIVIHKGSVPGASFFG